MTDISARFVCSRAGLRVSLMGLLCAAGFLISAPAGAQSVDGAVRLSLEGTLAAFESRSLEEESLGVDADLDVTSFSLLAPGLGIGLGYATSDHFALNLRLLLATSSTELEAETRSSSMVSFIPQFEYIFSGGAVRPFLGVSLGYQTRNDKAELAGLEPSESKAQHWLFGPSVGLHAFATDSFSIDPSVSLWWAKGSTEMNGMKLDSSGTTVLVSVALSGWLGGQAGGNAADGSVGDGAAANGGSEAASTYGLPPLGLYSADAASANSTASNENAQDELLVEDGVLTQTLSLDSAAGPVRVRLIGHPETDGAQVDFRMTRSGAAEECQDVEIEIDGVRYPVRNVQTRRAKAGLASTVVDTLGQLTLEDVARLGRSKHDARLIACDSRWAIFAPERKQVQAFVERFRDSAQAAGSWGTFPAEAGAAEAGAAEAGAAEAEASGTASGEAEEANSNSDSEHADDSVSDPR